MQEKRNFRYRRNKFYNQLVSHNVIFLQQVILPAASQRAVP
jgi:hypothetical protein